MNIKNNKNCKITINDEGIAVSEKEKTADELFKKLGYEEELCTEAYGIYNTIIYANNIIMILFDKKEKRVSKLAGFPPVIINISNQEEKAINKKCKELRLDMMNKCKYLTIRSKNYEKYFYCRLDKKIINYTVECIKCVKNEPRKNKGINKVSKKKITVTQDTYNKVMQRDNGRCVMLNYECKGKIELHHVRYRSERKDLINEPNNCVCLCTFHHKLVHSNKKKYQPILLKILENK